MKQKELVYLLGSICVISICWVISNIYNKSVTSTLSETLQSEITVIHPRFDTDTLTQLKDRHHLNPLYRMDKGSTLPTSTPTLLPQSPAPTASQSGERRIQP